MPGGERYMSEQRGENGVDRKFGHMLGTGERIKVSCLVDKVMASADLTLRSGKTGNS